MFYSLLSFQLFFINIFFVEGNDEDVESLWAFKQWEIVYGFYCLIRRGDVWFYHLLGRTSHGENLCVFGISAFMVYFVPDLIVIYMFGMLSFYIEIFGWWSKFIGIRLFGLSRCGT